ncbi:hypothetical protein EIK77_000690, partial [Talaromyces pinophilus]
LSTLLDNKDIKKLSDKELSSLSNTPNTIIKPFIEYNKSPLKNKGHAMSKELLKSYSPSILSMNTLSSNILSLNILSLNNTNLQ